MRRLIFVLLALTACGGSDTAPGLVFDPDAGAWVEQQPTFNTDAGVLAPRASDAGTSSGSDAGLPPVQGACAAGTTCGFVWRYYGAGTAFLYCQTCKMVNGGLGFDIQCSAESTGSCVEGEVCGAGFCKSHDEWIPCSGRKGTVINGGTTCRTGDDMGGIYYDLPCECR